MNQDIVYDFEEEVTGLDKILNSSQKGIPVGKLVGIIGQAGVEKNCLAESIIQYLKFNEIGENKTMDFENQRIDHISNKVFQTNDKIFEIKNYRLKENDESEFGIDDRIKKDIENYCKLNNSTVEKEYNLVLNKKSKLPKRCREYLIKMLKK